MDPRELLVDLMDTDFGLLDKLLACETLTRREMNEIKEVRSRYDRNKMLLEYIDKKGSHKQFKTALSETRQKHLVNYLDSNGVYSSEFGDDWPLTGNELKVLDANQDTLVELLDPNELINLLVGKKIINYRQLKVINSKSNEFRRNELLIEIFRRGSRHDYQKIVQCLRLSNQEHIADILQFGGVVVQVHADLGEDNQSEAKIVSSFRRFLRSKSPQEQQRIIDLVQLQNDDMQLIELSPSSRIGLFFHCRTSKGLDNLYEMVTSGRLKQIVEITFMRVLQPSKTLTTVTDIRLEESQYHRCKKYFEDISAASIEDFSEMIDPEENVDISRRLITRDVAGLTVCSICSNPFTKPRSLPCFHRFCLQCLEEEFAHKRKPGNKIACPNCAQIVKVPVDGIASLPRNLFLDKLLQASGTADEELYSHRACDKCKENDEDKPDDNAGLATMHCTECKQNLCENCYREHRRHRPSRSHSVVELRSRENVGCKEHPENVAVKYCSDSESFICIECDCFEDKEELHKHIDVKQMMEESRRIIETVKDEVLDLLDETYSYDLRQLLLDSISETESNIVAKCDEMKKAVESDKLELLQKLDLIKGNRLREIKTEQDAIESHRSDLQWFLRIVEELKEKGSPSDLTDARIGVSAEVAVLQDNHRSLRKRVEEEEVSCYVELSLNNICDQLKDKKQNCIGTIKVGSNTKKVRDSDNAYYYSPDSLVDEEYSSPLQANVEKGLTREESVSAVMESAISFTAADSQNPESQPEMSAARIPRVIPRAIPRVIPRKTVTAPASLNSQLPDATTRRTTDDLSFRHPSSLTPVQLNSAVTIEFDFNHIGQKNRAAVEVAYREVRRTFLEYLNRRIFTTASPTYSTTTASNALTATTTNAITTTITTATKTTTTTPSLVYLQRKRKRRNSGGNYDTFTDYDLGFVDNDPEIDENGNLRITIFIYKEGVGDLDLGEHLYEVANSLNKSGKLEAAAKAPIVNIFKGLPRRLSPVVTLQLEFKLWLPILLTTVVLLLICIFILVRYWCARNKKNIGKREISSSIDGLMTERTDTLRESRGRQRMDFPQPEICAISSNEEETKEQIVWGKLNLMGH